MKRFLFPILFYMVCALHARAQQQEQRPNILWIVSEDNSPMLGCYGDKFATTPNLDKFSQTAILYENAFSQPACALSRSTLITGMLATSLGTEDMRSNYPIPAFIKFFPQYLRKAGYFTTNNAKKDYNTVDQPSTWDESSPRATYKHRKPGQPFFAVFNLGVTHESSIHRPAATLTHDPEKVPIPPYQPRTEEMKHDWALYYDKVEAMDKQVAKLLQELADAGLADNTIVFYYADNAGVLGRSKRFVYDSGVHVPLMIHFPEKYQQLAPAKPGTRTDRVVSFEDFAPSILSLAGVKIPDYLKGTPFLGPQMAPEKEYAYGFRGRIDESLELMRTIRNKKYRYIRNYMPHKIYGQHNEYLWQAKSMASWDKAYREGGLNALQSAFWHQKPTEELFDIAADPYNVSNLAGKKEYQAILEKMRKDNHNYILKINDAGFIPESMRVTISATGTVYDFAKSKEYPLSRILETAEIGTTRDAKYLKELTARLSDKNPIVRYWAATGCTVLGKKALKAKPQLITLLKDTSLAVRVAASEALYGFGDVDLEIPALTNVLSSDNQYDRVEALTVLEAMGKDVKPALPAIKEMLALRDNKKKQYEMLWEYPHDIKLAKRIIANTASN